MSAGAVGAVGSLGRPAEEDVAGEEGQLDDRLAAAVKSHVLDERQEAADAEPGQIIGQGFFLSTAGVQDVPGTGRPKYARTLSHGQPGIEQGSHTATTF